MATKLWIIVPITASSLTSARCVDGVKNGSLSLLFVTLTVSVVVPDKLGVPERVRIVYIIK